MVVGADGLHSRVRHILFGPEERFERFLGYAFAAFTVAGYQPRDADAYITYGVPGRQASRFAMRGNRTLVLLLWREEGNRLPEDAEAQRTLLRERFGGIGWELPRMLEALDDATDLYVDAVSQIRLPCWSKGRIALLGDAAWAPSFLAGEGTGLGIIGAYVLAGELARAHGHPGAFRSYEERLRKFVDSKQDAASSYGAAFIPKTKLGLSVRNAVASALNIPLIARLVFGRTLKDHLQLADYDVSSREPATCTQDHGGE